MRLDLSVADLNRRQAIGPPADPRPLSELTAALSGFARSPGAGAVLGRERRRGPRRRRPPPERAAHATTAAWPTPALTSPRRSAARRSSAARPGAAPSVSSRAVSALRSVMEAFGWSAYLLVFIPVAVALEVAHADPVIVFAASALGVIPTASLMGTATEQLAARSGPGIGGLLNVTFGNAPELIIALFALGAGLHEVVKASIIGSILGNILLVMGAAMLVGGRNRERQYFDRTAASVQSIMLLLAIAALVMPALFELIEGTGLPNPGDEIINYDSTVEQLSFAVAIVLILTYAAGLLFSLRTHRALFNPVGDEEDLHEGEP